MGGRRLDEPLVLMLPERKEGNRFLGGFFARARVRDMLRGGPPEIARGFRRLGPLADLARKDLCALYIRLDAPSQVRMRGLYEDRFGRDIHDDAGGRHGPPTHSLGRDAVPPRSSVLLFAAALLALAHDALPAAPCPRGGAPPALPARLGAVAAAPAEERDALALALRPDAIDVRRYGARTAALVHFHRLDGPENLFRHAPEVCHALAGFTVLDAGPAALPSGRTVRRIVLERIGSRRIVLLAYLDPSGARPEASMSRAWLAALGRALAREGGGGSLLIFSSGDLPERAQDLEERAGAEAMDALLAGLAR